MKKIYLITSLVAGMSAFAQNANVALSNLSSNNGYANYNSSTKQISGIFFEILSDGNSSTNVLNDFQTSLYLLTCDANGNVTGTTPIIIKTYNVSGMNQMSALDYSNESVDLSQVSGLNDDTYRLGVWVNSDIGIPQPPDNPNDNAGLLQSSAGTAAGSVINYSSSGSTTGITAIAGNNTQIQVYPNPVSDSVTFSNIKTGVISISDISGKVVESITVTEGNASLNMSNYNAGIYFYQVKSDNGLISGKIIKK